MIVLSTYWETKKVYFYFTRFTIPGEPASDAVYIGLCLSIFKLLPSGLKTVFTVLIKICKDCWNINIDDKVFSKPTNWYTLFQTLHRVPSLIILITIWRIILQHMMLHKISEMMILQKLNWMRFESIIVEKWWWWLNGALRDWLTALLSILDQPSGINLWTIVFLSEIRENISYRLCLKGTRSLFYMHIRSIWDADRPKNCKVHNTGYYRIFDCGDILDREMHRKGFLS